MAGVSTASRTDRKALSLSPRSIGDEREVDLFLRPGEAIRAVRGGNMVSLGGAQKLAGNLGPPVACPGILMQEQACIRWSASEDLQ